MTTITDADLKELKELINSRFDKIDNSLERAIHRIEALEIGQVRIEQKLEGEIKRLDERLNTFGVAVGKIPDLAEKVGELKNWRQIAIIVITGTFGSVLGWLLRGERL